MTFGAKLNKLRKDRGWTQADLARRARVDKVHLSRLENSRSLPSVELLGKLARTLAVTMDYLMDEQADELAPVSIQDESLAERIELLNQLNCEDRQTVINVIDSMLTKKKMLDLLTGDRVSAH